MRLLHTSTLTLEFFQSAIPQFAILSHRWEEEEVLYDDIRNGLTDKVKAMKGYSKLQQSCTLASQQGYDYIWIDTCCIDKASSAELSESINSMFTWYRNAGICYAYLSDIHPHDYERSGFISSQWFTRGWTLQELVAPSTVIFYNSQWKPIGTKEELCREIQRRTGVPSAVLVCVEPLIGDCGSCSGGRMGFIRIGEGVRQCSHHTSQGRSLSHVLQTCSIAQRMSWAARRNTTRIEDAAYCLLGIFGVNMPLLYGEGMRAFLRLQEEIIKTTDDQSILAFSRDGPEWPFEGQDSLLAETPHYFADKRNISPVEKGDKFPMTPSSKSISMEMTLCPLKLWEPDSDDDFDMPLPREAEVVRKPPDENQLWLGILSCADASVHHDPKHPAIMLQEVNRENSIFRRVYSNRIVEVGFLMLKGAVKIILENTYQEATIYICDGEAVQKNIHLLLMTKEPVRQERCQPLPLRFLSLADNTPANMQFCYSFPPPNAIHRNTTFSMRPKHEYKGYTLCGILAFDLQHTPLDKERFWVFYGCGPQFQSTWSKITSTATILKLNKKYERRYFPHCHQQLVGDRIEKVEAETYMWEAPRPWEWIVGLTDGYYPRLDSREASGIDQDCSVTAIFGSLRRMFLGEYHYSVLSLGVQRGYPV